MARWLDGDGWMADGWGQMLVEERIEKKKKEKKKRRSCPGTGGRFSAQNTRTDTERQTRWGRDGDGDGNGKGKGGREKKREGANQPTNYVQLKSTFRN